MSSGKIRQTKTRAAAIAVAGSGSIAALALIGRTRLLRWGATDEEIDAAQPGDDLIADPDISATRAITVRRSSDVVWPWVAQLGQGRGGFYSYDFLENLVGCDIHSANSVVARWQQVQVGDDVRLAPNAALEVALAEPGHALVLRGSVPLGSSPPFDFTWAFVLCEAPDGTTRLLARERYSYKRWWTRLLVEPTEVISFVMTRKMLLGIRARAERGSFIVSPVNEQVARVGAVSP
jgi:hypothetical protein